MSAVTHRSNKGVLSTQPTRKLTEGDQNLLESVGRFCIRAKHSSWETVSHQNDTEAVFILRDVSGWLLPSEYRALVDGWSHYRLNKDDSGLNGAVEALTKRLSTTG
jgi:hypothetical protein